MTLTDAKEKFVCAWGSFCIDWGVNKTMGQIHALLLVSPEALYADQIMKYLKVSRGNVNMNLRALISWGLVFKVIKTGERKEYFTAEKNIWKAFQKIVEQRKRKELDPVISLLDDISCVEPNCKDSDEFCRMVRELKVITCKADQTLQTVIDSDPEWLTKTFTKVI